MLVGLPIFASSLLAFDHAQSVGATTRERFAGKPKLGTAVRKEDVADQAIARIIADNFSIVSPERDLKMSVTWPNRSKYDFSGFDTIYRFAQRTGLRVRGHTLIWHNSVPGWSRAAVSVSRPQMYRLIEGYAGALGRYAFCSWDVVNEALADASGKGDLRDSFWLRSLGENYIAEIFAIARSIHPSTPLIYNDYGLEFGGFKQQAALRLLRRLVDKGVPISGLGLQSHLFARDNPAFPSLWRFVENVTALGIGIYITELDISSKYVADHRNDEDIDLATERTLNAYLSCFAGARIREITTWGVTDRHSWLNPQGHLRQRPLPFDANGRPKRMWTAIENLAVDR
ncbi:endo-1,4-beta-xylanase [Sphingomonas dokdonensis]|nr:endo-1,4-beta-xylanase [Sphingomonas dokdonensis]